MYIYMYIYLYIYIIYIYIYIYICIIEYLFNKYGKLRKALWICLNLFKFTKIILNEKVFTVAAIQLL